MKHRDSPPITPARGAIELDQIGSLALFALVVQFRSFTAAAEQTGLAKSAVSKRIARLERDAGVQLLRRSTRKLALTEEGVRFYEHCARILEATKEATTTIATATTEVRGVLRVAAPTTFAQMYLAPALAAFLKQYPAIELDLQLDNRLHDVIDSGADVLLRIAKLKEGTYVTRKLATDRLVVCAAPSYLEAHGTPGSPGDLVHHNCLHYALVAATDEWRFRGASGPYTVPIRGNVHSTDGTLLRELALQGTGIIVVPSFMVAEDVRAGRLALLLEGHRRAEIGIHAVTSPGAPIPRRARAFVDFLARWFARTRWL